MVISCLSQTAYQFDSIACSLSLTYFTNAVVNINSGNGNIQTFSLTCKIFIWNRPYIYDWNLTKILN